MCIAWQIRAKCYVYLSVLAEYHWKKMIPSKLCNYFGKTLAKQIFQNCSENWNFEFPELFQWIEFQCMEFLWKSFLMCLRIDGFWKMFGSC